MAKEIGEDTKVTLDLKTIGMGAAGLAALIGMWFALQTIMTTQEDVSELKEDLDRIEEKIDKLQ